MMYQFEQPGCEGPAYMYAETGLAQPALVIDSTVYYPSGAVAERPVGSLKYDSGACSNVPPGFTAQNAEVKSAPLSDLGFGSAFHLAK
jgi:hypothetical protein